jgi:hypothetical protein
MSKTSLIGRVGAKMMRHARWQVLSILFLLLLSEGCRRSISGSAEQPATTATPVAAPAAPVPPPPPFSAAQKLGMFAYGRNSQSHDQQLRDEYDCYTQVQQQTGICADMAGKLLVE